MLSDDDIERLCDELNLPIVGVFSKDRLPEEPVEGSYYINLQNAEDGGGTHWVFAKIIGDDAIYCDSFGIDMPKEVSNFLAPFKPIPYNNKQIQDINTTQCGYYCLYCDYYLTHLRKRDDVVEDFENYLNLWSDNPRDNLTKLKKFFKPL